MQRTCLEISFPCCCNVKLAGNTFSEKMSYVLLKDVDACVPIRLLFLLPLIFNLLTASISRFLNAVLKFSCFSSNEIRHLYFFISRFSSLSLLFSLSFASPLRLLSHFLCLSLSFFSKFVNMTINLSLIAELSRGKLPIRENLVIT